MIKAHSPVARTGVQVASPLAMVIGIYLLFAGHNNPGGGFAAGLVFGAVVALRSTVSLPQPMRANSLIAFGLATVAIVAIAPMATGESLLDQQVLSIEVPIIGKMKSGTALPFDIGVTAIVVGLVIALLDGLSITSSSPATKPLEVS